ncbi:hypothetical protein [Alicycliphilus denitrificans]|uniref:hypothetical protein n=1 Tax=Alicycliphilus denitrificans TaxID=179636 RepID=UPI00384E7106
MLAQLPPLLGSVDAGIDSSGQTAHEQIILHLDERGFVPFHPALAETFGHKAAIFVGMALYWTRHSLRKYPQRGGWFHMSMPQWQQAIGLTRSEQASVRETLMQAGILEEMLIGRPAVMNYRINVSALVESLSCSTAGLTRPTWDAVGSWLRSCKVYYKPLADVAGNIAAGLYLSYLLQCHRDRVRLGQLDNGCISVSQDDIAVALTLGTKVQRNARDRLKKAGLIQESGAGGSLVRINFDAVLMCLRGQAIKPLKGRANKQATLQHPETPAPLQQRSQVQSEAAAGLLPAADKPEKQPSELAAGTRVNLSGLGIAFGQLSLNLARPAPVAAQTQRSRDLLLAFLADDPAAHPLVGNRQVGRSGDAADAADATTKVGEKSNLDNGLDEGCEAAGASTKNAVSCNLENAETCKQELPFPATYIQECITINTTTTSNTCEEVTKSSGSGVENSSHTGEKAHAEHVIDQPTALIFPAKLSDSQRVAVESVVKRLPESERQELLDELHGKLENGKEVRSPAAWLNGIIAKKANGEDIVLTYAAEVAAKREPMTEGKLTTQGNKLGIFAARPERFTASNEMEEAMQFLKHGVVYVMQSTGTLVKVDNSINVIRIKLKNSAAWAVTMTAGPLVKAIRANEVAEYEGGDE